MRALIHQMMNDLIFIHIKTSTFYLTYTGCLKKNETQIQQGVTHHMLNLTI